MNQLLENYGPWFEGLAIASAAFFLLSLIVVPLVMVSLPVDYFDRRRDAQKTLFSRHPLVGGCVLVLKNLLGAVLVLLGLLLLVLPGQGLLTIALGVALLNFPGKERIERRLISQPQVLKSINWLRQRCGRSPLELGSESG